MSSRLIGRSYQAFCPAQSVFEVFLDPYSQYSIPTYPWREEKSGPYAKGPLIDMSLLVAVDRPHLRQNDEVTVYEICTQNHLTIEHLAKRQGPKIAILSSSLRYPCTLRNNNFPTLSLDLKKEELGSSRENSAESCSTSLS